MINIKKSPQPIGYKGNYGTSEFLEIIKNDFFNKCYICEESEIENINIEHFIPHKGNDMLKNNWDNLFLACPHCNNIKSDRYNDSIDNQILNCTESAHNILENIDFEILPFPNEMPKISARNKTNITENTVKLLNEVYIGTTPQKQIEATNLRKSIEQEIWKFTELLFKYFDKEVGGTEKIFIKERIVNKISKKSRFSAFKVFIIKRNTSIFNEFREYIV